jgi:hypothetical protein
MPVRAMIKHFRHEFEAKIQAGAGAAPTPALSQGERVSTEARSA